MTQQSDESLFELHRRGDSGAMRILIERHQPGLMRFLTRLVGDAAGAEDVFQEAFLQAHVASHTFDAERKFRPLVIHDCREQARDHLRRRARRRTLDLSAPIDAVVGSGGDGTAGSFIDLMEIDIPPPDAAMEQQELSRRFRGCWI